MSMTQYKTDIKALQRVLAMIHSTPDASLVIEPHRVQLTISGKYAWNVHSVEEIAYVLNRTKIESDTVSDILGD